MWCPWLSEESGGCRCARGIAEAHCGLGCAAHCIDLPAARAGGYWSCWQLSPQYNDRADDELLWQMCIALGSWRVQVATGVEGKAAVPVGRRLLTALEGNGACQQLCFLRILLWVLQVLFTNLLPYSE